MKIRHVASVAPALAALGLYLFALPPAGAADFVSVSPMNRGRDYHTLTLLPNGKVLVAGGYDSTVTELFDPATGTWTQTGRLGAVRRFDHTATLLPNGKVLVAGGYGNGSQLSSAELYDPASGAWAFTAPMRTRREDHTANLLANGKVLVAGGGISGIGSISSAELYDPASGTWTAAGAMTTARDSHTATLLPNGKVLVTGGIKIPPGTNLSSAELYDPATGTWTVTGSMSGKSETRWEYTATLLPNGKVLVAGGCPCRDIQGDKPSAELYDPASGTWTPTGPMNTGRGFHTATLLFNGKVLVTGGYSGRSSAELYDPVTGTWTPTDTMGSARWTHKATALLNGNVLVSGGSGPTSSAEVYRPDSTGAPPSITILHHANELMSFSWTGAGILEQSDSLTDANWQPSPIQDNPLTVGITSPRKFFRLRFNQ